MPLKTVSWRAPAPRWRQSVPPGFVRPCEPALVDRPPAGPEWLHEIKHDGFRIFAWKQGERVRVWSRRGADFADRFHGIADAVRGLNVDEAMIDGEAVVFRGDGRSDFHALLTKRGWLMASFVAFDLLRLGDDDLRQRPLEKRREALMRARLGEHDDAFFGERFVEYDSVAAPLGDEPRDASKLHRHL